MSLILQLYNSLNVLALVAVSEMQGTAVTQFSASNHHHVSLPALEPSRGHVATGVGWWAGCQVLGFSCLIWLAAAGAQAEPLAAIFAWLAARAAQFLHVVSVAAPPPAAPRSGVRAAAAAALSAVAPRCGSEGAASAAAQEAAAEEARSRALAQLIIDIARCAERGGPGRPLSASRC